MDKDRWNGAHPNSVLEGIYIYISSEDTVQIAHYK